MRVSTVVFVIASLACWFLTYSWAKNLTTKKQQDLPIVLGKLPELPHIILPSIDSSPTSHSDPGVGDCGDDESPAQDNAGAANPEIAENSEPDLFQEANKKLDRLKFTPPPPLPPTASSPQDFDVRDIPMFTPRDTLLAT